MFKLWCEWGLRLNPACRLQKLKKGPVSYLLNTKFFIQLKTENVNGRDVDLLTGSVQMSVITKWTHNNNTFCECKRLLWSYGSKDVEVFLFAWRKLRQTSGNSDILFFLFFRHATRTCEQKLVFTSHFTSRKLEATSIVCQ